MKSVQIDIEKVIEKVVKYLNNKNYAESNAISSLMAISLSSEDYDYFYKEILKRMK